jgi:hypothetical protein
LPESEIRAALNLVREYGIEIGGVDIRADGVTVFPKQESQGSAFDAWKQDKNRARPAHS